MTWNDVESKLLYWDGTTTWSYGTGPTPGILDGSAQTAIHDALYDLYDRSETAKDAIDGAIATYGYLRFGNSGSSGTTHTFGGSIDGYILVNPATADDAGYLSGHGDWIASTLEATLAHELVHMGFGLSDPSEPDPAAYQAPLTIQDYWEDRNEILNGSEYDYMGDVVYYTNQILSELELLASDRNSYNAFLNGNDTRIGSFSTEVNYTNESTVDITRIGGSFADNMDISSREDQASSLMFGLSGNDVMVGNLSSDYLYGGDDKDKLYGGEGGDWLYGEAGNDFLDSGFNGSSINPIWDSLFGGSGNDILIMRGDGEFNEATGGSGDDQFWIEDTSSTSYFSILDPDSGDSLYWHGYHLTGGIKTIVDAERSPYLQVYVEALDSNGFRYIAYEGIDGLAIYAPDGSTVSINNFQEGDLGIYIGDPIGDDEYDWQYNSQTETWELDTDLPISSIAFNNDSYDVENLPGFSFTLNNHGPNSTPTTYLT